MRCGPSDPESLAAQASRDSLAASFELSVPPPCAGPETLHKVGGALLAWSVLACSSSALRRRQRRRPACRCCCCVRLAVVQEGRGDGRFQGERLKAEPRWESSSQMCAPCVWVWILKAHSQQISCTANAAAGGATGVWETRVHGLYAGQST